MMAAVLILLLLAFLVGVAAGRAYILALIRSGRVVAAGRVYHCKDTGPVVR